jgi:short-subunit dehydrogenase
MPVNMTQSIGARRRLRKSGVGGTIRADMKRELREMVVVITGASAGIGHELAIQLAHAGARLVLAARRVERLTALNEELGATHLVVPTDVGDAAQCERLARSARDRFGRIDTFVCNAGYGLGRPVASTSADELNAIFRTNVFGTTDCIRAGVAVMRGQSLRDGLRGQIVVVSSAAARRAIPFFGAYSATKAAQLSLAEAMRVEMKPHRIAVTSVHPIGTNTEFIEASERATGTQIPVPGTRETRQSPEVVARAVVRAIRTPRPEVWPHFLSRFGLSLATLMPGAVDRIFANYRRELDNFSRD